jgi:succinylglutamic semialdehyde dehydrogenase
MRFESINPSDGSLVWSGEAASAEAVHESVIRARSAFPKWAARSLDERIACVERFASVLERQSEALAATISREIGKPLWESRTEVKAMIGKIPISIEAQAKRCADFTGGPAVTRFRPHGVVAVLGPYNFPGHLPNGHIVPALLAGNTVLFKPSEQAPATAELTFACWREAGLPDGVLQVLQGSVDTAKALTAETDLDGLFFTGSARTGKLLARQFAETPGKILALELGGNNPLIVDLDTIADLEAAVVMVIQSAFLSAGQRCTCARRLILPRSSKRKDFLEQLTQRAQSLRIDDPFAEPPPFMGPLASAEFVATATGAQEALLENGATALLSARPLREATGFISPGLLDVTACRKRPDEEIFAPILQLIEVDTLESAVTEANATRYGLAAGILSDAAAVYTQVAPHLRAGILNWNQQLTGASSAAPFGGIGDSGNHRPSAFLAADYCAYPVASIEVPTCHLPATLPPGL